MLAQILDAAEQLRAGVDPCSHWHLHCQVVDAERPSQASSTSWLHAVLLAQILDAAEQLRGQGWEYDLDAAFVEVYNEGLRDLLAEGRGRDAGRIADQNAVKHAPAGESLLHQAPVTTPVGCGSAVGASCPGCCAS